MTENAKAGDLWLKKIYKNNVEIDSVENIVHHIVKFDNNIDNIITILLFYYNIVDHIANFQGEAW